MDFKETPYWWEAAPRPTLDEQPVQQTCDVAIIGAGFAGLTAALILARAGRNVQVFDKQRPGEGASSRNGGIMSYFSTTQNSVITCITVLVSNNSRVIFTISITKHRVRYCTWPCICQGYRWKR